MPSDICIVSYDRELRPDAALAEVVRRLSASGLRVGGLLQTGDGGTSSRCATLILQDIGSGREVRIFEDRGSGARGCRLASCGLAEAATWLGAAIGARPDILFVNRFGRQEAEGRGLLDEIAAAVIADLPVVVPVAESLLPAWRTFAGEEVCRLPPDADRLEAWCRSRIAVMAAGSCPPATGSKLLGVPDGPA